MAERDLKARYSQQRNSGERIFTLENIMTTRLSIQRALTKAVVCVAICSVLNSGTARAQAEPSRSPSSGTPWALINGVGFGAAGIGVGLGVAWFGSSGGYGDGVAITGLGALTGIIGGAVIGHRAGTALRNGRPISRLHQLGVSAGAVLAGSALGGLAAVPLINGEGSGTALGSDETTVITTLAVGTTIGALFAWQQQRSLRAHRVSVVNTRTARGADGIGLRVEF